MNNGSNKIWDLNMNLEREEVNNNLAIYGSRAFEHLVTNLWDKDKWVRIAAADALAGLEDLRAYRYMVALLVDTDPDVRFAVSISLGKLGDTRAIRPLESACHDCNYFVRPGRRGIIETAQ
jgi:HEAT repeat protein